MRLQRGEDRGFVSLSVNGPEAEGRNYSLREDIRAYWSERSRTFDLSFGHRIPLGPEFDAWASLVTDAIGRRPQHVLELACGTGEVTNVLLSLGHSVTALALPNQCSSAQR